MVPLSFGEEDIYKESEGVYIMSTKGDLGATFMVQHPFTNIMCQSNASVSAIHILADN